MPNIIFMGTPEFAVPTLEAINSKYGLSAVVTVPDKPKGRGRKLSGSPVKEKAVELGLPVLQPEKLKDIDFIEKLKSYNPDIICVIAFRILPEEVFDLPKIASFNIHGSLLPKYRGAAPINRAIMNGEEKSGLTSFILQKKVDTGDLLETKEIEITKDMTAGDLHDAMMPLAAELSLETIELLQNGQFAPIKQDDSVATPAPKIFRDDCKIDFHYNAETVYNQIRGLSPYPAAWTKINGKEIKILKARIADSAHHAPADYFVANKGLFLGTETDDIEVLELKPEGKKAMSAEDFVRGWRGLDTGKLT